MRWSILKKTTTKLQKNTKSNIPKALENEQKQKYTSKGCEDSTRGSLSPAFSLAK